MGKASNPQMGKQRHRRNFGPQHSDVSEDHAYVDIDDATNVQFLFLLLLSRHPCHPRCPPHPPEVEFVHAVSVKFLPVV